MTNYAKTIRKHAAKQDVALADLARKAGITPQELNSILSGKRDPSLKKAESIAKALGLGLAIIAK